MRVLHVLSQRPALTGSGVTLEALVRQAGRAGWAQRVVCAAPIGEPSPGVGGLEPGQIRPLWFGRPPLDFALPGMSDVMPYPSSVFARLSPGRLAAYRAGWRAHLRSVLADFAPDVIHAHHVWLLSAQLKEVVPRVPLIVHCHGTGLRQLALCPALAAEVRRGCARADRFAVLAEPQVAELGAALGVDRRRITVVGAGYDQEVFCVRGAVADRGRRLVYAGKLSAAKGLGALLAAFELLRRRLPGVELDVAGDGSGAEAEALRRRLAALGPAVRFHGQLGQRRLAELFRRAAVFVLPSFFEGLGLVLVEAAACGCRLVASDLPAIRSGLLPALGGQLRLVRPPAMAGVDTPAEDELPAFEARLAEALADSLAEARSGKPPGGAAVIEPFTWGAVFSRVERIWRDLTAGPGS